MWVQLKAFVFSWAFGMAAIQHCMLWHFFYVDSCDRNVDCTTLPLWHSCWVGNTRIWGERWRCVSTSSSLWIFAEVFLSWRLLRRGSLTFISIISIGQSPFAPEKSQILTDCSLLNCLILKWEARFSSLQSFSSFSIGFWWTSWHLVLSVCSCLDRSRLFPSSWPALHQFSSSTCSLATLEVPHSRTDHTWH